MKIDVKTLEICSYIIQVTFNYKYRHLYVNTCTHLDSNSLHKSKTGPQQSASIKARARAHTGYCSLIIRLTIFFFVSQP